MSQVLLDQAGDKNGTEFHKFSKLYNIPEFVKSANFEEVCGPSKKVLSVYADVRQPYQFPFHTKAATWVSYLYFLEKKAEINPKLRDLIQSRLDRAAGYWAIKKAVAALQTKHAELYQDTESKLPDSIFAYVWRADDGTKERRYPLRNPGEIKAAAAWYASYIPELRKAFSFTDRQTIARKILDKAAQSQLNLGETRPTLEKAAGQGFCNPKDAALVLRNRIKAANKVEPAIRQHMLTLADSIEHKPLAFLDPSTLDKLAQTIDIFDRSHGILGNYGRIIESPEDSIFKQSYSDAREFAKTACKTTTGAVYTQDDFSKLSITEVRDAFGDDLAKEVSDGLKVDPIKFAEIATTLPRNDAQLLDDLMSSKGLQPLAKESEVNHLGFSPQQWQQIATCPRS